MKYKDYKEFSIVTKKAKQSHYFSVSNSYGLTDYYKYYTQHSKFSRPEKLSRETFKSLIATINNKLAEQFVLGEDIKFPNRMGTLEPRKKIRTVRLKKSGAVFCTAPVDWKQTYELWFEDEEAKEQKILVRREDKEYCVINYNKRNTKYKNYFFYRFIITRGVYTKLVQNLQSKKIDLFLNY